MGLDKLMEGVSSEDGLTDFEMLLAERKAAMEKCASLSCGGNGVAFLRDDLAERVLYEYFNVDELKLLVDFYFGCEKPFPLIMGGAPLVDVGKEKAANGEKHYARVIRKIGRVADVNRSLYLDKKGGPFHNLLYAFVQGYNDLTGQRIRLDVESFPKDVREEGWRLFTDTKDFANELLRELLHKEDSGVSERARGQREADRARDEKERNFTRVRNYEKEAIRSAGREKDALVDDCLRTYPFLGYYYELPDSVQTAFLNVLKKAYMMKAVEDRLPLRDVFVGLDNELYSSLEPSTGVRGEIGTIYAKHLNILNALSAADLHPDREQCEDAVNELLQVLMKGIYEPRTRAVFNFNNAFDNGDFAKVREVINLLYLSAGSLRKRIRDGRLNGIKVGYAKYLPEPKAGYYAVEKGSVEEMRRRYGLQGVSKPRVLKIGKVDDLSFMGENGFYLLRLDRNRERPFRDRVRESVLGHKGYKTITLGKNEMLAVPPEIVKGIRRGA